MDIREHPKACSFKLAAERYCALLESIPTDPEHWIEDLLAATANLYAQCLDLPEFDFDDGAGEASESFDVKDEQWKDVYNLVHQILRDQVCYWSYFDPSQPTSAHEEAVFGDLGDDLADIYHDVKPCVRAWEHLVKFPLFGSHWGVHAVSAMRALHPIAFLRGIQIANDKSPST